MITGIVVLFLGAINLAMAVAGGHPLNYWVAGWCMGLGVATILNEIANRSARVRA